MRGLCRRCQVQRVCVRVFCKMMGEEYGVEGVKRGGEFRFDLRGGCGFHLLVGN